MDDDPPLGVDEDEWSAIVGVGAQTALWCKELGAQAAPGCRAMPGARRGFGFHHQLLDAKGSINCT